MALKKMREVARSCKRCGDQFTFRLMRGSSRKYCGSKCARAVALERYHSRRRQLTCKVAGCDKPPQNIKQGLCAAHYTRVRRTGTTERAAVNTSWVNQAGYVVVKRPDHPLSRQTGWLYEHRAVAYDLHGLGPHPCTWCGESLEWDEIAVDHLNEVKSDNRPENLALSCVQCNRSRGAVVPFVRGLSDDAFRRLVDTFQLLRAAAA